MYNDITGKGFGKLIAVKELSKYPDNKWLFNRCIMLPKSRVDKIISHST